MRNILIVRTALTPEVKLLRDAIQRHDLAIEHCAYRDCAQLLATAPASGLALLRIADASAAARRFAFAGWDVVNTPDAIDLCRDKIGQALLWRRHGIPAPDFQLAFTADQIPDAVAALGGRIVVKEPSGSWGRKMARFDADDPACVEILTSMQPAYDGRANPLLFQRYVEKGDHDFRVLVVGDRPILVYRRTSTDWRTNRRRGASVGKEVITDEIEKITTRVIDVVGPGFFGIDLMRETSTRELKMIEINHNPEFARTAEELRADVAEPLAEYLASRLRWPTISERKPEPGNGAISRRGFTPVRAAVRCDRASQPGPSEGR